MMPAANRAPTEMPPAFARMTMAMLGGMMPPIVALTEVSAAAYSGS